MNRSGLVAACLLPRSGHDADDAIDVVRTHRRGSIQTAAQEEYVRDFAG